MPKLLQSFGKQSLTLSERRKSGHLALLKSSFNLCHSCSFFSCEFQKPCFAVITFKPFLIEHLTDFGKILRAHMRKHLHAHTHTHTLDATSWGRLLLLSWWPCQLEVEIIGSFTLPETFGQKPGLIFLNMLNRVMSARWNLVIGVAIHMNTKKKWFADFFVINFPVSKPTKVPQTHRPRNCAYLYRPPKSTHKGG